MWEKHLADLKPGLQNIKRQLKLESGLIRASRSIANTVTHPSTGSLKFSLQPRVKIKTNSGMTFEWKRHFGSAILAVDQKEVSMKTGGHM
jgi:hypothetical protein